MLPPIGEIQPNLLQTFSIPSILKTYSNPYKHWGLIYFCIHVAYRKCGFGIENYWKTVKIKPLPPAIIFPVNICFLPCRSRFKQKQGCKGGSNSLVRNLPVNSPFICPASHSTPTQLRPSSDCCPTVVGGMSDLCRRYVGPKWE